MLTIITAKNAFNSCLSKLLIPLICYQREKHWIRELKKIGAALNEREVVAQLSAIKPFNRCGTDKVLCGRMLAGMWKMKSDLKKAGIQFMQNGRRADFHALRHTFNAAGWRLFSVTPALFNLGSVEFP